MFTSSKSFTRTFVSASPWLAPDKYYKITRYVKPVPKSYSAGDIIPAGKKVTIPPNRRSYPIYQYETLFFKQQNKGLYGGLQRSSGHTCSESGNKNLRSRKPNIVTASLYSETLDKIFKIKVSTRVLKTVDKEGGLDNYLLKEKPARIKTMGKLGWRIKYDILKALEEKERPSINGQPVYCHYNGQPIAVGKHKLLDQLYPLVKRDSYEPLDKRSFLAKYSWKTSEELCKELETLGYDLGKVSCK